MAIEVKSWTVDSNPIESLIGLGDGDLMAGIRKARKLAKNIGAGRVGNIMVCSGTTTVAVGATTAEVTFKFHQPFKLCYLWTETTVGGELSGIKINGKPVEINYGYTLISGSSFAVDLADLAGIADCDLQEIWGAGAEVTVQGSTLTAGDAFSVILVGMDLNWDVS